MSGFDVILILMIGGALAFGIAKAGWMPFLLIVGIIAALVALAGGVSWIVGRLQSRDNWWR